MLPDADVDVDIDDLIDDDDDEEEEDEQNDEIDLGTEDLTTDEDEQHRLTTSSSSSSPVTATEQADADASAAADDSKTTVPPAEAAAASSASDEDRTSELNETQANEQQQTTISSDDVADTTGELNDVLPVHGPAKQTEDAGMKRSASAEETTDQCQSPEDSDHTDSLVEDREPETCNADDGEAQEYCSSVTAEADVNQQVCKSTAAAESNDVIPLAASSASATESTTFSSLSLTSSEQSQHAEVVDTQREKFKRTIEDQGKGEENDMKSAIEMARGETESEQNDKNDQIDLDVSSQSELQVKSDREPDSSAVILTEENRGNCRTEMQELGTVQEETTVDMEKRPLIGPDDEVTSQKVGHEEVKVTEEPEVTENAEVGREGVEVVEESEVTEQQVTEEVKVTYEASAKQLDLLSRLAMLREKAAQRKAEQSSDDTTTDSAQDSQQTTSDEHRRLSTHREDSPGPEHSPRPQQKNDDHPDTSTKTDFRRRSVDKDTDRQTDISTAIDTDTEQQNTKVTRSPSPGCKSKPDQLVSTAVDGDGTSSGSLSAVMKRDDDDDTVVKTQSADVNSLSTDESVRPQIHSERQNISTADVLTNGASTNTIDTSSDTVRKSTTQDADTNQQLLQPSPSASCSTNTDTHELHGEVSGPPDSISKTETDQRDQLGSTEAVSHTEDRRISGGSTAAANVGVQSLSADIATEQTDAGKTTDNELRTSTADLRPQLIDSSGTGQLEGTSTPSDTATDQRSTVTSVSTENSVDTEPRSSEPTHRPDNDDDAVNYDSDLDDQFATTDAGQLLVDVRTLKSRSTDGPGYLYVLADQARRRVRIGASRSPVKRLRQATAFNPDLTLLTSQPVTRRLAALGELRRRLLTASDVSKCPCHVTPQASPLDWFTGSDDAITEHVRLVQAAEK